LNSLRKMWPNTKIQRCMKHVVDYVQRQLTWQPETAAGQCLYKRSYDIMENKDTWWQDKVIEFFEVIWW
jgi:hypothetical protein